MKGREDHLYIHHIHIRVYSINTVLHLHPIMSMSTSWVYDYRNGHGDTSKGNIRRHSFSYSCAFEEDPREPGYQLL